MTRKVTFVTSTLPASSPMRKILTHSAMMMFMSCRTKYAARYLHHLVPMNRPRALSLGSAVHAGLEVWFKSHNAQFAVDTAASYADLGPEDSVKAAEMVRMYTEEYEDDDFVVIDVERSFQVPLRHPETKRRSTMWDLAGKVDGLVEKNGKLYILEHKTTTAMTDDYWARVDIDSQIMTYAIALSQELKRPIYGAIYDVLRKPLLKMKQGETDEEFEARKAASKTGRVQRKEAESALDFAARVRANLEPTDFVRKTVVFNGSDLYDHWTRLWELGKDMAAVERGKGCVYQNTSACLGFSTCPYLKLCRCNGDVSKCAEDYETLEPNAELKETP